MYHTLDCIEELPKPEMAAIAMSEEIAQLSSIAFLLEL